MKIPTLMQVGTVAINILCSGHCGWGAEPRWHGGAGLAAFIAVQPAAPRSSFERPSSPLRFRANLWKPDSGCGDDSWSVAVSGEFALIAVMTMVYDIIQASVGGAGRLRHHVRLMQSLFLPAVAIGLQRLRSWDRTGARHPGVSGRRSLPRLR
jgi:hypothetical protein